MRKILEFRDVKKEYQIGELTIQALKGVDFDINEGEFVVILGASGAGKSVLLRSIAMLEKPDEGQIIFNGTDLTAKGVNINKRDEKGQTILFTLAAKRKLEALKILIRNGANLTIEDNHRKTVLDEAVDRGDGMMIRFLLDNGFHINHKNNSGRTIFQDVALKGNNKVFQIFMKYNADFNLKDSTGRTVLFDAVDGGNIDILRDVINNINNITK